MKLDGKSLALLFLLVTPFAGHCCEPILPIAQLLSGTTIGGSFLITQSLFWLVAAVAIKSGAFSILEKRLSRWQAVLFMVLANVVSTIPGILIASLAASMAASLVAIPFVAAVGALVARRLALARGKASYGPIGGTTIAVAFTVFFFVSVAVFEFAGSALGNQNYAIYWLLKFIFVALVAVTGILISAVIEEWFIGVLTRKTHPATTFYTSVVRSNYVTLMAILLVAAIQILPKRLHSGHFLASWLHHLSSMLGLA